MLLARDGYAHSSFLPPPLELESGCKLRLRKYCGSASCSTEGCRATPRFSHFMNEILQLRGTNTCTVKAVGMQTRARNRYMLGCCNLWGTRLGVAAVHGCLADDFYDRGESLGTVACLFYSRTFVTSAYYLFRSSVPVSCSRQLDLAHSSLRGPYQHEEGCREIGQGHCCQFCGTRT